MIRSTSLWRWTTARRRCSRRIGISELYAERSISNTRIRCPTRFSAASRPSRRQDEMEPADPQRGFFRGGSFPPWVTATAARVSSGRRLFLGGVVGGFRSAPAALHRLGQLPETARDEHRHCDDAHREGDEGTQEDDGEGEEDGQEILEASERVRSVPASAASTTPALDGERRGCGLPRPRVVDGVEVDVVGARGRRSALPGVGVIARHEGYLTRRAPRRRLVEPDLEGDRAAREADHALRLRVRIHGARRPGEGYAERSGGDGPAERRDRGRRPNGDNEEQNDPEPDPEDGATLHDPSTLLLSYLNHAERVARLITGRSRAPRPCPHRFSGDIPRWPGSSDQSTKA